MYDSELTMYEHALDLSAPWQIVDRHFSKEAERLDIFIRNTLSNTKGSQSGLRSIAPICRLRSSVAWRKSFQGPS